MVGRTNYSPPTTAMPPNGPEQMVDIYEHFDKIVGENVDTASSLPAANNWPGRTVWVRDAFLYYLWDSGWTPLAGKLQKTAATPLSGAQLDNVDPLTFYWDGLSADLYGTINVNTGVWQVGWQVCAPLPADSASARARPRQQRFQFARSGSALLQIKITTAGVVTIDEQIGSGSLANYLVLFGNRWFTRP